MLELATVDSEIMERNRLINLLNQSVEDIDFVRKNSPTKIKTEGMDILNTKIAQEKELKERYVFLVRL